MLLTSGVTVPLLFWLLWATSLLVEMTIAERRKSMAETGYFINQKIVVHTNVSLLFISVAVRFPFPPCPPLHSILLLPFHFSLNRGSLLNPAGAVSSASGFGRSGKSCFWWQNVQSITYMCHNWNSELTLYANKISSSMGITDILK